MEWEQFWNLLLEKHKLKLKVEEINQVDKVKNHSINTEEICRRIYNDYSVWRNDCERVKKELWEIIEKFPQVHLHTSRIKTLESLIEKVIRKRYEWLADDSSKYANIDANNYRNIITDLVGIRLIVNYRGYWQDLHEEIIRKFPFVQDRIYETDKLLEHMPQCDIQAEIPKVYYAPGDDCDNYTQHGLLAKQHKMNYRSIHYTVSFHGIYIEIQVRTIYDEAWSDCNHHYVYKKDDNKNHVALEQISGVLSKLTNLSNDIGEQMKKIYDSELLLKRAENKWETSQALVNEWDKIIQRMEDIEKDIKIFRNKLIIEKV